MFGLQALKSSRKRVLGKLKEFEEYCLGQGALSPDEFMKINEELSLGTIMHIGKRKLLRDTDGTHLIWIAPDKRDYDLGPVHKLDFIHNGPGFQRSCSLALDNNIIEKNEILEIPHLKKQVSLVHLKDGSVGVGPNYKVALRNAALKMHLGKAFRLSNPPDAWKEFYSNA